MGPQKTCVFLAILAVVTLQNCQAKPSGNHASNHEIMSDLRDCIVQAGSNTSDIVEYYVDDYERYIELNYQWNLIHERKYPLGYFTVRNVGDVQAAVRCAREQWIRVVPKGGGHSYEEYSFGDNTTLIVDFRHMYEMYVSPDRQWFSIGAGALLGQLAYPLLEQYNLVTPHGTCPTVGITGLATGGGYGYMAKLSIMIIEVELVDSTGSVLIANKQTNSDLFWALRGAGSGSFGIITKLSFRAHPAPALVTAGAITYPLDQFRSVFQQWQLFTRDSYHERYTNTKLVIKDGNVIVEVFDIQVSDDDEQAAIQRVHHNLNKFPTTSLNLTEVIADRYVDYIFRTSHPDDVGIEDPSQLPNVTRSMFTPRNFHAKSFFVKRVIELEDIWRLYNLLVETLGDIEDIIIEMYAFGGAIDDMSPTLDTSFNHRNGTLYLVQAFYNGKSSLNPYHPSLDWLTRFYETTELVFLHTESYQNYPDATLQDYLTRYYGSNVERLRQVKRTVDPQNIFYHPQSIPI